VKSLIDNIYEIETIIITYLLTSEMSWFAARETIDNEPNIMPRGTKFEVRSEHWALKKWALSTGKLSAGHWALRRGRYTAI